MVSSWSSEQEMADVWPCNADKDRTESHISGEQAKASSCVNAYKKTHWNLKKTPK